MSFTGEEIEKIKDKFCTEIKTVILWDDYFLTSSTNENEIKKAKEEYWDSCNGSDDQYSLNLTLEKLIKIRNERFGLPDNPYSTQCENLARLKVEISHEADKLIDYCVGRRFSYNQIPEKVFRRCIDLFIKKNKSKLVITIHGRWLPDFHYGGVSE